MSIPLEQGLPSARAKKRAAARPANRKEATDALEQSAIVTTGAITQRVLELGVDIAKDLALQTEWSIVVTGVTFVLARLLKIPQLLVIIAGIQVLLLAVIVYAGLDYVGYRELRFPNLTKGVAEIIRESLGIAYPS